MRVLIKTGVELYPQTILIIGDEEIRFPVVPREYEATAGSDVPDEIAGRWKQARDAWLQAQQEAEEYVGYRYDA